MTNEFEKQAHEEKWDKETQADQDRKMADIGKGEKLTMDEYLRLRKEGKIN